MKSRIIHLILVLLILAAISLACGLPAANQPATIVSPEKTAAAGAQPASAPGDFNLPDAGIGLDALDGYTGILTTTYSGTRSGVPYQSTAALTHQVGSNPVAASLTTLVGSGTGSQDISMTAAEIAGITYLYSGPEQPCQAFSKDLNPETFAMPNAPAQLPAVTGAEVVGEENMNGILAKHYHFDQRSLADYPAGITASGDLWLAVQGGWVVRYDLTLAAPENILGVGFAGEVNWQYQVTPGDPLITPPQVCSDLPFDIPRLEDASQVYMIPGYLEYESGSAVDSIGLFYSALTGQGWTMIHSTQGSLTLKNVSDAYQTFAWINIIPQGTQNRVEIIVSKFSPENAEPLVASTPVVQPTFDLATSGLPEGVPIYANAHDMHGMEQKFITYQVDASISEVVEFYTSQLQTGGWELAMQMEGMSQFQKDGLMVFVQAIEQESAGVQVMITWVNTP